MPSKYTIIQFVPDPVTDERINIGVVVYSGAQVRTRFLHEWSRVKRFGMRDIGFLRDFAKTIGTSAAPELAFEHLEVAPRLTGAMIETASSEWINSIQFTAPRASLKDVDALLAEVSYRFLAEPVRQGVGIRDRQRAISIAVHLIRAALQEQVGEQAEDLVKRRQEIEGALQPHTFDAVIANGVPYLAAQALSFEGTDYTPLRKSIDATAWTLYDVHARDRTLPLGVVVLPPRAGVANADRMAALFEETQAVYEQIGATVVTDAEAPAWASKVIATLPFHH